MKRLVRSLLLLVGLASLSACAASDGVTPARPAIEAARLDPAPPPPPPAQISNSRIVVVGFDSDSAEIRAGAMQVLHGAATDLRNTRLTAIRVVGHADASGRRAYNQRLSERRAAAVADQLRKLGLQADTVEVRGAGERPAPGDGKGKARRKSAEDRRVEIVFESVETGALPASSNHAPAALDNVSAASALVPGLVPPLAVAAPDGAQIGALPSPDRLRSVDKPAIKRDLLADGTSWLPPPDDREDAMEGWPSGLRQRS